MLQAMEAGDEGMRVHTKNAKTCKEFSLLVIWPASLGPGTGQMLEQGPVFVDLGIPYTA